MKKILFCLMALLCVMGVSAQSRSMTTTIPSEYQFSVDLSIDNQSFELVPQKISVQEADSSHVEVILFHNRGRADVTLPVSYDFTLEVVKTFWDLAYKWHFISPEEYQQGVVVYNKQHNPQKSS